MSPKWSRDLKVIPCIAECVTPLYKLPVTLSFQTSFSCVALLKDLSADHGGDNSLQLAEQALQLVKDIPPLDFDSREHRTAALQLHTVAINTWNLAVGMKTSGSSSLFLNAHCES